MRKFFQSAVIIVLALSLLSCLSVDSGSFSRFSLYVTDAPVDGALSVVVQFSAVEVHRAKGTETINFVPPKQIDLVKYSRGAWAYLADYVELPADDYLWVKLKVDAEAGVDDSYIILADETKHELQIPADALADLKVEMPFTLTSDGTANLTIDFDLRKSIQQTVDGYVLRPALRMVDNAQSGTIYGAVNPGLLSDATCIEGAAVYVYSGAGVTPTDISNSAGGPVTSTNVAIYWYTQAFLPAGTYTIALTCDGELDEPDEVNALTFLTQADVEVPDARQAAYFNFDPE